MDQEERQVTTEQRIAQLELTANCAALLAAQAKADNKKLVIVCSVSALIVIGTVLYYQARVKKLEEEIQKMRKDSESGNNKSDLY